MPKGVNQFCQAVTIAPWARKFWLLNATRPLLARAGVDGEHCRSSDHHIAFGASAGLIIFGGNDLTRGHMMSDAWLLDVKTGQWHLAATEGPRPSPRTFNADGGGGGILRDQKTQREWMVIYGGLRGEGYRDNETWLLGPLESDCAIWRWQEIEEGREVSCCESWMAEQIH
eukprot:s2877_g1.t1